MTIRANDCMIPDTELCITEVIHDICRQVLSLELDEGKVFPSEVVQEFAPERSDKDGTPLQDKNMSNLLKRMKEEPNRTERLEMLRDFTTELGYDKENDYAYEKCLNKLTLMALEKTLMTEPERVIPRKLSNELRDMAESIRAGGKMLLFSKDEIRNAIEKVAHEYVTDSRMNCYWINNLNKVNNVILESQKDKPNLMHALQDRTMHSVVKGVLENAAIEGVEIALNHKYKDLVFHPLTFSTPSNHICRCELNAQDILMGNREMTMSSDGHEWKCRLPDELYQKLNDRAMELAFKHSHANDSRNTMQQTDPER